MEQKVFLRRGFTLIELAIVLCVSAMLAGALVPSFVKSAHIEAARKTAAEMTLLKEAAQHYFLKNAAWPEDLEALRASGDIDERWPGRNPFGDLYVVTPDVGGLVLSTKVPSAMGDVVTGALAMSVQQDGEVSLRVTSSLDGAGVPVGALLTWPSEDIPEGWVLCDGRALERAAYSALFALLGVSYGVGDGVTTFNVPDLRGRIPVGLDNMGGSAANVVSGPLARTLGGKYGEESHALTVTEMPSHNHYGFGENIPRWPYGTSGPNNNQGPPHADYDNYLLGTTFSGGNASHNNLQPSIALYWMIKT